MKSFSRHPTLLLLALFVLSFGQGQALAHPGEDDPAQLEKVILEELKERGTPGAAVAVIKDGRLIFSKGFGVMSVEAGGAITPDTLFRLGSTTKMSSGVSPLETNSKTTWRLFPALTERPSIFSQAYTRREESYKINDE